MADFLSALDEVVPAFGSNTESLELCRQHGIIDYGDAFKHLQQTLKTLVNQVQISSVARLVGYPLGGVQKMPSQVPHSDKTSLLLVLLDNVVHLNHIRGPFLRPSSSCPPPDPPPQARHSYKTSVLSALLLEAHFCL